MNFPAIKAELESRGYSQLSDDAIRKMLAAAIENMRETPNATGRTPPDASA
jgi:hypothetical protein